MATVDKHQPKRKHKQNEERVVSKKIMMQKYGLNVGAAYVETATLLEPNNFIPSWESGGEEKVEVSSALKKLRESYDQTRKQVLDQKRQLWLLEVSNHDIPSDPISHVDRKK
jgi:hypothetical protein